MSLIGSVGGLIPSSFTRLSGTTQAGALDPATAQFAPKLTGAAGSEATPPTGFNQVLGQNDQLHQSVIAMQEASVAFTLMVEVRNKLVESYQELMRMPV